MCLLLIVAIPAFFTLWFGFSSILGWVGAPGDIAAPVGAAIAAAYVYGLGRWAWRIAGVRVDAMLKSADEHGVGRGPDEGEPERLDAQP